MSVKVKIKFEGKDIPAYATEGAAGMDIRANISERIKIAPGKRALIPTGIYLEIPEGYECQIPVRVEDDDTSKVNYKEKINDNNSIYEVYAAEKKADALAFLKFKSVHKPNFYIVVDTPEGNIGRDINGIYEE